MTTRKFVVNKCLRVFIINLLLRKVYSLSMKMLSRIITLIQHNCMGRDVPKVRKSSVLLMVMHDQWKQLFSVFNLFKDCSRRGWGINRMSNAGKISLHSWRLTLILPWPLSLSNLIHSSSEGIAPLSLRRSACIVSFVCVHMCTII